MPTLPDISRLGFEFDQTTLIIDSTKMKTYMDCPRKFFFEYILGWRSEAPSLALEFGSAWHIAMETLLKSLQTTGQYTDEAVAEAYAGFYNYLAPIFDPRTQSLSMAPKDYANAMQALVAYKQRYADDRLKVHYTEISGSIPIGSGREMFFRVDAVCENERGMFALEHKTASRLERTWAEQWTLSVQVGCYTHVLYCLWGQDRVWGVTVNGAIFRKTGNEFMRVPIYKTQDMMQVWLEIANHYYTRIEEDLERLATKDSPSNQTMQSFPMNTESCTKYGLCQFHDLCAVWPNPLKNIHRRPPGFTTRFWDPRSLDQNAEIVLRDGKPVEKTIDV